MSRIGNKIIEIPAGVEFKNENGFVTVKGKLGTLTQQFNQNITFEIENGIITVKRPNDLKVMRELHGTTRALLSNMIVGVTTGFKKTLDIVGIGYRASMKGTDLLLHIGYSHEVIITPDETVKISTPSNVEVVVEGINRQAVGQTAARIRAVREPEPYKGKGIKYREEVILRKEGKRAGKK